MNKNFKRPSLNPNITTGAQVLSRGEESWRLEIPAGEKGRYRLAQLDDYGALPRRSFPWAAPFHLSLRARASSTTIPGTWGFGLWNNPFGMAILKGAEVLRLPALPNSAWFFFASPPNYLSLYDDLPAQGWMAATFHSAPIPPPLLALGAPALPLLLWPPTTRLLRRIARRFVEQDAIALTVSTLQWHKYELVWVDNAVTFHVDGEVVLETEISPNGPLGLVIWVDNQYAALPPNGRSAFGTLENPEPAWIEIEDLVVKEPGA